MKFLSMVATLFGAVGLLVMRQEGLALSTLVIATFTLVFGLMLAGGIAGLVTCRLRAAFGLD